MSKQEYKQQYLDFDQYIRQGEPAQKERAEAWRVAIGLQAVDGLNTSEYLHQTARKNIEGDITIDEARELIKSYYLSKKQHPASTQQVPSKYPASWGEVTRNQEALVAAIGEDELSVTEQLAALGLKDRMNFVTLFLNPAIQSGFVQALYPDKPRHPRQKYLLTAKGMMLLRMMKER